MEIITRKEAKHKGLEWYYTGQPCKYGHFSERRVASGDCLECMRLRSKHEYDQTNGARHKRLYYENRDEKLEKQKQRDENRKQQIRQYQKQWRYYNAEHIQDYRVKNKALYAAHTAKRRSLERNSTPLWCDMQQLRQIYDRVQFLKQEHNVEYHVDHIIPLNSPRVCGLHTPENLQIMLGEDNKRKSNRFE